MNEMSESKVWSYENSTSSDVLEDLGDKITCS